MKITLRSVNDDWEELLIDGKLMLEGHSLPLSEVIKLVKPPDAEFTQTHVNRCAYCDTVLPDDAQMSPSARAFICQPKCPHD